MDRNGEQKPSLLFVVVLIIIAFVLIVAVFFLSGKSTGSPIILPDHDLDQTQSPNDEISKQDSFLQVTPENVLDVVATMSRPVSYHQVYHVTLSQGERKTEQIVDIWVDGTLLRADVSSETGTSSILTSGSTAYLWHSDEDGYVSVELNDTVSVDDLLGLPTYELLLQVDPDALTDASYLVISENDIQCIYVSAAPQIAVEEEYWIDVSSGLLYQARFFSGEALIYEAVQTALERLAAGDEAFSDRFLLPDGIRPF